MSDEAVLRTALEERDRALELLQRATDVALAASGKLQEWVSREAKDDSWRRVDPLLQIAIMLKWEEDYTDEFKVQKLREAFEHILAGCSVRSNHGH